MNTVKMVRRLKQVKNRSWFYHENTDIPHKFVKTSPFTCGNSWCCMCGNPRKFLGERTMQEKRFIQTEKFAFDSEADS